MKIIFSILYTLDRVATLVFKPVLLILIIELIMIAINIQGFEITFDNPQ